MGKNGVMAVQTMGAVVSPLMVNGRYRDTAMLMSIFEGGGNADCGVLGDDRKQQQCARSASGGSDVDSSRQRHDDVTESIAIDFSRTSLRLAFSREV